MSEEPEGISTTRRNMLKTGAALGGGGLLAGCSGDDGESSGEDSTSDTSQTSGSTPSETKGEKTTVESASSTKNISPGTMPFDVGSISNYDLAERWLIPDDIVAPNKAIPGYDEPEDSVEVGINRETAREAATGKEDMISNMDDVLDALNADPDIVASSTSQPILWYFEDGAPMLEEAQTQFDFGYVDSIHGFPVYFGGPSRYAPDTTVLVQGTNTMMPLGGTEETSDEDLLEAVEFQLGNALNEEEENPAMKQRPDFEAVMRNAPEDALGIYATIFYGDGDERTEGTYITQDGEKKDLTYKLTEGEVAEAKK